MSEDRVAFILGPDSMPEAQAFMPIADRYQVGGVGCKSGSSRPLPIFPPFRSAPRGSAKVTPIWCKVCDKGTKIDTVAITYANNDDGRLSPIRGRSTHGEGRVKVLESIAVEPGVKDMTPIVLKVKNLAPDAVISSCISRTVCCCIGRASISVMTIRSWLGGSAGFSDANCGRRLARSRREDADPVVGLAFDSEDCDVPGLKDALAKASAAVATRSSIKASCSVCKPRTPVRALQNAVPMIPSRSTRGSRP